MIICSAIRTGGKIRPRSDSSGTQTTGACFSYESSVSLAAFIAGIVASTFFVQGVEHGVNPLSALAPLVLGRIEILIYRYIKHCHYLIKRVEAGVPAVILVIHDGARNPVNNIGRLLLRYPDGLLRPLDGESYIVKIKALSISLNLKSIT